MKRKLLWLTSLALCLSGCSDEWELLITAPHEEAITDNGRISHTEDKTVETGGENTETVGYHDGYLVLNFGANDGIYNCKETHSSNPKDYQRVSYGYSDWFDSNPYVLTRQ